MGGGGVASRVGLGVLNASHPVTGHDLRHSEAIHRYGPQEAFNDLLAWRGYIRGNGIGALQDTTLESGCGSGFEWHSGSHHEVQ